MPRFLSSLVQWIDSDYSAESPEAIRAQPDGVNLVRCIPFIRVAPRLPGGDLGRLELFAVWLAVALYFVRMFAVTGIFHRYFSHKTYSTSRFGQFLLALWTGTTVQRGRSGGPTITAITTSIRTSRRTPTRRMSTASCGRTSAGSPASATSRPTIPRSRTSPSTPSSSG